MKHFKLLLFAFTLLFSISAIAAPTTEKGPKAKKERKAPAEKKSKKFTTVTYYYIGPVPATASDIRNPNNWSTSGSCPTGNTRLCSISFDTNTYPLDEDQPNSTVLNHVATNLVTGGTTPTSYTIVSSTITITLRS